MVASEIALKRGIEREPDIIASMSAPNDPIPVLLPFGSHGEYRQIVVGIDDAVLDLFLQIWYASARSPPPCCSSRIALPVLDKMRSMSSFVSCF